MRLGELFSEMGVFSSVLQEDSWRSYIWSIECNDRRIWISCVSYEFTTENIEDCAISALNFSHSTNNVLWFVRSHRWSQNFSSLILRNALLVFCRYPSFFFFPERRPSGFKFALYLTFDLNFLFMNALFATSMLYLSITGYSVTERTHQMRSFDASQENFWCFRITS